jgi:hypothetical protein
MKFLIISSIFLFSGHISAQKVVPKISSLYTNLDSDCRTIEGHSGTDDASNCRGIGGYRIHIWYSAVTQMIAAEIPGTKEMINLATLGLDFDQRKVKVEWRMAGGKPFAIILRVAKYGEPDQDNPYTGPRIGEELIIIGLKGFEKIDFKVDAKTPKANARARELADNAFLNK